MKEGSCVATPFFTLFYKESPATAQGVNQSVNSAAAPCRVAYIAGKKNGNAVWRNKAKRKLRAAWQLKGRDPQGMDILLVAKKAATEVSAIRIAEEIDTVLSQQGLLQ